MSRILPRFIQPPIVVDRLEIALAQRDAREAEAREAINRGLPPEATPQELRGIPCQAMGVGGTQPGTDPLQAVIAKEALALRVVRRPAHTTD